MKKGLTLVELVIILGLIPIIIGMVVSIIKVQNYVENVRDLRRIQDLNALNNALNFYFRNAALPDPDGPNLDRRGMDESSSTVFVSVPIEVDVFSNSSTYYVYQTNKNDYQRIDGYGWIPINFQEVNYPVLSNIPIDPINTKNSGLYYLYSFRRVPLGYEVSAALESSKFKKGGVNDLVSRDGGNDDSRLEMGTDLKIIPPF
jgi:hypothetical protein